MVEDVEHGARVVYYPSYLARDAAHELFAWMRAYVAWQRETPFVCGRTHEVRRRTYAYGDPGIVYRYSGLERTASPWPGELVGLRDRLRADLGSAFNFALCNLYPDGQASIQRHTDAEGDLVPGHPIVGVSLGATRDFVLYHHDKGRIAKVPLEHGSLIVMLGGAESRFAHAVPKRVGVKDARISITFRVVKPRVPA